MGIYTKKDIEKINKKYKKIFKESGCRLLSDEEMQNVSDSMSLLSSGDVKIIRAAQSGNYSNFNDASPLVRNYVGTLALRSLMSETEVSQEQLSLANDKVKKYVHEHVLDAGLRVGLSALKHSFPENDSFREIDEYTNECLFAQTLASPTQETIENLNGQLGTAQANKELKRNAAKQVVMAKMLFMTQLGKYSVKDNGEASEYKGSIAETFAHGGRTNFILPFNDVNNEVLTAFDGGVLGKRAGVSSRIAATHSATQREVNMDYSVKKESKEEKPKFSEIGKIFSHQYGMDIAVGGVGNLGPNQKPILADGSAGHVYIRKQPGSETTCGSLMIGIESAASLKTSYTGHFHTPLAKSSKQSAFLSDKFGPGDKTDGKTVDLSGLDSTKLAFLLKNFEERYTQLQTTGNTKALNLVNDLLVGKRMSEKAMVSLMIDVLGMSKEASIEGVSAARKGIGARVQSERESFEKQFSEILGVDLRSKEAIDSIKVMQKNVTGEMKLSSLFETSDTPEQRFSKFWRAVQTKQSMYHVSPTNPNPREINVSGRTLSVSEPIKKQTLTEPKAPNGIQRALHKLTRGALFSSSIRQYEMDKANFEKQEVVNSFIDEHSVVVEQNRRSMRSQEGREQFIKDLAENLERTTTKEKSSMVNGTRSKEEVTRKM